MSRKRQFKAPCMYMEYDERKKEMVETYPAVHCKNECGSCGWNPAVREARLLIRRLKQ